MQVENGGSTTVTICWWERYDCKNNCMKSSLLCTSSLIYCSTLAPASSATGSRSESSSFIAFALNEKKEHDAAVAKAPELHRIMLTIQAGHAIGCYLPQAKAPCVTGPREPNKHKHTHTTTHIKTCAIESLCKTIHEYTYSIHEYTTYMHVRRYMNIHTDCFLSFPPGSRCVCVCMCV